MGQLAAANGHVQPEELHCALVSILQVCGTVLKKCYVTHLFKDVMFFTSSYAPRTLKEHWSDIWDWTFVLHFEWTMKYNKIKKEFRCYSTCLPELCACTVSPHASITIVVMYASPSSPCSCSPTICKPAFPYGECNQSHDITRSIFGILSSVILGRSWSYVRAHECSLAGPELLSQKALALSRRKPVTSVGSISQSICS